MHLLFLLLCGLSFASQRYIYKMDQRPNLIRQVAYPFQNYSLSWDVRVDDLISRLSLEEIVNLTLAGFVDLFHVNSNVLISFVLYIVKSS